MMQMASRRSRSGRSEERAGHDVCPHQLAAASFGTARRKIKVQTLCLNRPSVPSTQHRHAVREITVWRERRELRNDYAAADERPRIAYEVRTTPPLRGSADRLTARMPPAGERRSSGVYAALIPVPRTRRNLSLMSDLEMRAGP
ncbi:hypothetical protein A0H81_05579 [Grifola frondosa]|uniref:Uncharacterized protein n=1 Tax=Grifola frondosa TaxID=5627 RepID=A0A1C7MD96_GRIFR|nr:hypothetical protein A0H81_05579 [Grifola frondosa]